MSQEQKPPRRFLSHLLVAVLFLAVGTVGGAMLKKHFPTVTEAASAFSGDGEVRQNSSAYQFINPLLECDLGETIIGSPKSTPSRVRLEKLIADAKERQDVSHVSVYYRDLNNGPWMGINERERFAPASLLKVPLVMSFYKRTEQEPSLLSTMVTLGQERQQMPQFFKPNIPLELGGTYTIRELMEHAIRYSDNDAAAALIDISPADPLQGLFDALHIEPVMTTDNIISVKDYAAFFRVLFNASYLTSGHSEYMLKTLTESDFNKGLTAQLPQGVMVAHKFGERSDYGNGSEKQLHDCGIVYVPQNPYLLCMMTRGEEMERMANVIGDLSKAVYDEVTAQ